MTSKQFHRTAPFAVAAALFSLSFVCFAGEPAKRPKISWEAAGMEPAMESRIEHAVSQSIERGDMCGCVVLVGRRDGIVFERAFGNRAIEPAKEPMTTDTLFDMASLTKPVATATSVMILVERGQLRLQDKVVKFFPEFAANGKEEITVENLLTHSSGLIPDNPLADYHDGWNSAKPMICNLKPGAAPGQEFKYSDINFILLGKIVESVTGKPLSEFAKEEIYSKLGMKDSGYLPSDELKARAETVEKRDDKWMKGEVHDPRSYAMGGVAGHAGLFSTAEDLAIYATMMLNRGHYGDVQIMSEATFNEMICPRDIGGQERPLVDHHTGYSRNRGELMSNQAFGHGGFTGTAMWIDPGLDLYVIFLGNRLHPDGVGDVNDLAGRIGSISCAAITKPNKGHERVGKAVAVLRQFQVEKRSHAADENPNTQASGSVRLGIDVLVADKFKQLDGKRVGLITNQTGLDSSGVTTIDRLHEAKNVKLVSLFSPEHGIRGVLDQSNISDSKDEKTGLPIHSLYGERREPSKEQFDEIDALVFDVQDVGARFYTNTATMALSMEAAAKAGKEFFVLDRPDPIGGEIIEGPLLDEKKESFVGIHQIPIRYGLTIGELAKMYAKERKIDVKLTVIPMEHWRRDSYLYDTGMRWTNTSPNMRSLTAAVLYPGIGVMEFTNISVGRGTDTPFEVMGAPWIHERELAAAVNAANPPGVRVMPIRFTPKGNKFDGQECGGLYFIITDWSKFRSFELGLTVAHALRKLHPKEWEPERFMRLLGNQAVYDRIVAGDGVASILEMIEKQTSEFRERRKPFLMYP